MKTDVVRNLLCMFSAVCKQKQRQRLNNASIFLLSDTSCTICTFQPFCFTRCNTHTHKHACAWACVRVRASTLFCRASSLAAVVLESLIQFFVLEKLCNWFLNCKAVALFHLLGQEHKKIIKSKIRQTPRHSCLLSSKTVNRSCESFLTSFFSSCVAAARQTECGQMFSNWEIFKPAFSRIWVHVESR